MLHNYSSFSTSSVSAAPNREELTEMQKLKWGDPQHFLSSLTLRFPELVCWCPRVIYTPPKRCPLHLLTPAKFARQHSPTLTKVNVIPMTIGTNMKLKVVICSRQQSWSGFVWTSSYWMGGWRPLQHLLLNLGDLKERDTYLVKQDPMMRAWLPLTHANRFSVHSHTLEQSLTQTKDHHLGHAISFAGPFLRGESSTIPKVAWNYLLLSRAEDFHGQCWISALLWATFPMRKPDGSDLGLYFEH